MPAPSVAPGKLTGDCWAQARASAAGSPTLAEAVARQPSASVTVAKYWPTASPATDCAVPTVVPAAFFQTNENGACPPVKLSVAEPLLWPKQATFCVETAAPASVQPGVFS